MIGQLELFGRPSAATTFDPDATLRSLPPNEPGVCCGHWRAEHDNAETTGCRFCDCDGFAAA